MSTRSRQIRASRREKQARKWGGHEKAAPGAIRYGLRSINNEAYSVSRSQRPGRRRDI